MIWNIFPFTLHNNFSVVLLDILPIQGSRIQCGKVLKRNISFLSSSPLQDPHVRFLLLCTAAVQPSLQILLDLSRTWLCSDFWPLKKKKRRNFSIFLHIFAFFFLICLEWSCQKGHCSKACRLTVSIYFFVVRPPFDIWTKKKKKKDLLKRRSH